LTQALSAFPGMRLLDPASLASWGKALGAVLATGHPRCFTHSIAPNDPALNRVGEFRHKTF
jgi:hypothetical protein